MILIDLSQTFHSAVHSHFKEINETISKDLLRHVLLNIIFSVKNKSKTSGDLVLCCDGGNYWRKEFFPLYKANRKLKKKDPDGVDWSYLFPIFDELIQEFKEELPYKVMQVPRCEADDIIATLALTYPEDIVLISSDKDFLQLQEFKSNIRQYSHLQSKWLDVNDYPGLLEKVISGDSGDGIANFLSEDDCFINPDKRQTSLRKKRIDEIKSHNSYHEPQKFCLTETELRNFLRNKTLIDLREIPEALTSEIRTTFESLDVSKRKWFQYCIKYSLSDLIDRQPWK